MPHCRGTNGYSHQISSERMIEDIPVKKTCFTEARIMDSLRQMENDAPVFDLYGEHGTSSATV